MFCPIQQGLADNHPDVDAIFRLTRKSEIKFDKNLIILGKNSWSPFNSQNTIWFKPAFPLLYLPSTCSNRMTDIWRSFIAQRIAWEYDWNIAYFGASVFQERNIHNLIKDFEEEVPGYLNNTKICNKLEELALSKKESDIFDNLRYCYELMIHLKLLKNNELDILEDWIRDLSSFKI